MTEAASSWFNETPQLPLYPDASVATAVSAFRLKAQGLPWTDLMDASMVALHEEHGCTAQDIKAACARVPMHPRMKQVCWTCSFRSDECNLGESCVGVMCTETQCQKCVNAMTEGRQESSSQATFLIREAHGSQFFPMAIKPFEGARQHSQLR